MVHGHKENGKEWQKEGREGMEDLFLKAMKMASFRLPVALGAVMPSAEAQYSSEAAALCMDTYLKKVVWPSAFCGYTKALTETLDTWPTYPTH